mgnify:CR=1 FL=1
MICYKPIHDIVELKKKYPQIIFDEKMMYGGYFGVEEDGTFVGKCLFSIDGYNCCLILIDCDYSDKLLVEGFIRASLNYGANRNAYMALCEIDEISDVLLMLGFEKKNNTYSGDIPTLLKGSCCK